MAMGIPVITNSGVGDVAEIVDKYQSGIVIKKFDQDHFIQCVDTMVAANFDSKKIRFAANEFYSLKNAVESYKRIYDLILSNAA